MYGKINCNNATFPFVIAKYYKSGIEPSGGNTNVKLSL